MFKIDEVPPWYLTILLALQQYMIMFGSTVTVPFIIGKIIWKKVEEYLWLFETYGGNRFSLSLMGSLRKLMCFSGRMTLRMKLIAKKELNLLFQMTPSRILCDQ